MSSWRPWRLELVSFTVWSQHHIKHLSRIIQFEIIANNTPKLCQSFFASWETSIKSVMLCKRFRWAGDLNTIDCWRISVNKNNVNHIEATGNLNQTPQWTWWVRGLLKPRMTFCIQKNSKGFLLEANQLILWQSNLDQHKWAMKLWLNCRIWVSMFLLSPSNNHLNLDLLRTLYENKKSTTMRFVREKKYTAISESMKRWSHEGQNFHITLHHEGKPNCFHQTWFHLANPWQVPFWKCFFFLLNCW